MATPNLGLEIIQLTDNMQTSLLEKMNDNLIKIDNAYKVLKDNLLDKTGKSTLAEAIEYTSELTDTADGTITSDKVFDGYVGYAGQERIVGTALSEETTGLSEDLIQGKTFYDNSGKIVEGSLVVNTCYVSNLEPEDSEGADNDLWLIVGG
jgi:hypothetical protein